MSHFLLLIFILAMILGLDVSLFLYWDRIAVSLGEIFGFELGLAIFLNCLGVLLLLDTLQNRVQLPGFCWFYQLQPARSGILSDLLLGT